MVTSDESGTPVLLEVAWSTSHQTYAGTSCLLNTYELFMARKRFVRSTTSLGCDRKLVVNLTKPLPLLLCGGHVHMTVQMSYEPAPYYLSFK